MVKNIFKWVLAGTLAVGGVSTGLALASGTSALAATAGNLVVCAEGNYTGYVTVFARDSYAQPATPFQALPGQKCQDVYYGTSSFPNGVEVTIYGIYNVSRQSFYIAGPETFFPESQGMTVDLLGTSTSPQVYVH